MNCIYNFSQSYYKRLVDNYKVKVTLYEWSMFIIFVYMFGVLLSERDFSSTKKELYSTWQIQSQTMRTNTLKYFFRPFIQFIIE